MSHVGDILQRAYTKRRQRKKGNVIEKVARMNWSDLDRWLDRETKGKYLYV